MYKMPQISRTGFDDRVKFGLQLESQGFTHETISKRLNYKSVDSWKGARLYYLRKHNLIEKPQYTKIMPVEKPVERPGQLAFDLSLTSKLAGLLNISVSDLETIVDLLISCQLNKEVK